MMAGLSRGAAGSSRSVAMRCGAWLLLLPCALLALAQDGFPADPGPGTPGKAAARKIPVILDTDIGDDIDDTWALVLLLKSSEVDLKLVTTDHGNTLYRAKVVAKLLEVAGRTDVPVGIGIRRGDGEGGQAPWVKGYDLAKYPGKVYQDGVAALIEAIMKSPEPITLVCIGPVPNIQAALDKEPRIAEKARFVGMHGSVRKGFDGNKDPHAEYNVKANAAACRRALSAPWSVTITPLDTCGVVRLKGEKYAAVKGSKDPLTRALVENYRIWCGKDPERADRESSVLFDTVAAYLSFSEELLVMEKLGIRVTDDGFTRMDEKAKILSCAMAWKDLGAYEDFLVRRLAGK
jgi:inosine-uridine nucleoside N-ribohydrolase